MKISKQELIYILGPLLLLGLVILYFLNALNPDWIKNVGMIGVFAMTTGKHDFSPMKKRDIVIAVVVTIIALVFGAATWPK